MQMFTLGGLAKNAAEQEAPQTGNPAGVDGADGSDSRSPDERCASLRRTIESEIIPRLMLAHVLSSNEALAPDVAGASVEVGEVATLTQLVLGSDATRGAAYVRNRRESGVPVETLYLELLSPAAQRLGAMWEADLCDFTQVTVGLWRLQQIVFDLSPSFQRERGGKLPVRRALLVPAPGSQHTFGVMMLGEFFRRGGWDTHGDPCATVAQITELLSSQWFDLVGLSVGSEHQVRPMASAILALRKASLNRHLVVMVGGPVLAYLPDFVERVGADGTASDAAGAVNEAERLVALRASPS